MSFSREVLQATRLLCASRGSMTPLQLHRKLLETCDVTEEEFCFIIQRCPRFLLARGPAGADGERLQDCNVIAKTSLRLCGGYIREQCGSGAGSGSGSGPEEAAAGCQQLHLCKFFIYGTCRFGKGRRSCKFSHDIRSNHNYRLLRECSLHELDEDDLFLLLLQNDPTLLPQVCSHYNKGSAPHGCCTFQQSCTKLHLCQHFVQGDCVFGPRCKRQHAVDQHGRRMLEERGLSGDVIVELPSIYRNIHHLTAAAAASTEKPAEFVCSSDDSSDICLHFIRHSCRFNNECRRVHFHLPYKWEEFDGVAWVDLRDMEDIERRFCDPRHTQSHGDPPVDFLTMTRGSRPVRRLSTVSSVTKPPHYILTTRWLWYYKGDRGTWVEYGVPDEKQRSTSVTSQSLEEEFQADRTAKVTLVKAQRNYVISFTDMYQRNHRHNTKRRVRRRPHFLSAAEVKKLAAAAGSPRLDGFLPLEAGSD